MDRLWSLFNQIEKLRIDHLKTRDVRIILLAIPASQVRHWYACQDGDQNWKPLLYVDEFYDDVQTNAKVPPVAKQEIPDKTPVPSMAPAAAERNAAKPVKEERRPMFEEAPDLTADSTLAMESIPAQERRSARRYLRDILFTIEGTDNQRFHCATHDISVTGLSLTSKLPDWAQKNFKGRLQSGSEVVKVFCKRVSDTQLKILEAEPWETIRSWIVQG